MHFAIGFLIGLGIGYYVWAGDPPGPTFQDGRMAGWSETCREIMEYDRSIERRLNQDGIC